MSTIFTKIISKEIPADIIYEDEHVLAFLDINPIKKGHALVVPKVAYENIFDCDTMTLSHMVEVAQKIARAQVATLGAKGVNLQMNNGHEADQDIPHAHIHVIPRFARFEAFVRASHEAYTDGEGAHLAEILKKAIA
ncbi:HIT domain-containing protein [Candidatus Kaiserbacteria bacterium]|nr:MAG: HIT domain-containing protein [Candidatus Kaiserbacteria bacterium]